MKVTLVYPRLNRVDCGSGSIHMPLGILYLASYLREHGHQISVIDATFMDSWETFEWNLKKESPDIIGISFSSPLAEYGFKAAGIAKKCFPDRLVITGGPHSLVDMSGTICKDFIDMVVIGEGEKTLFEIVEACSQDKGFHHIKGICFKDGKKLVKTEDKTDFIENLDDLPMPALDLLDIEKYIQETGRVTFITSRGCPGKCYYCQPTIDKMFGRKIRGHSPERIIEEIKIVAERYYDKNKNFLFEFVDDTFCYSKKRTLEFCELIKKHALTNLPYWVISRIDHCKNKDVVVALKNAGCLGISFGVESGSQRILNEMGKNTSVQTIREVFHNCHQNNLLTVAFIMVGYPSETREDFLMTKRLIRKIHPDIVAVSITTPMLGTDLYDFAKENRMLNITTYSDFGYYGQNSPLKLEHLTNEEVVEFQKKIVVECFKNLYKNIFKYINIFLLRHGQKRKFCFSIIKRSLKARIKWLNF